MKEIDAMQLRVSQAHANNLKRNLEHDQRLKKERIEFEEKMNQQLKIAAD